MIKRGLWPSGFLIPEINMAVRGPVLLVCSWPRIRLWSAAVIVVMLSSGASAANGLGGVDGVFVEWTWEGLERGRLWFQPPC